MATGEFDSPSKPSNDDYRNNWDRIFGEKEEKELKELLAEEERKIFGSNIKAKIAPEVEQWLRAMTDEARKEVLNLGLFGLLQRYADEHKGQS